MLRLSTEHTISVNHWDAKSQRAKKTMIGHEQLNDTLDNLKMEVLKQIRDYKLQGVTEWPVLTYLIINNSDDNDHRYNHTPSA